MSHVVGVKTEITSRVCLEEGAEVCGLVAVNTTKMDWYGAWVNDYSAEDAAYRQGMDPAEYQDCEFALVLADSSLGQAEIKARSEGRHLTHEEAEQVRASHGNLPYSVGVKRQPGEGENYKLVYDKWARGRGLLDKIGDGAEKLVAEYTGKLIEKTIESKPGYFLRKKSRLSDGRLHYDVGVVTSASKIERG